MLSSHRPPSVFASGFSREFSRSQISVLPASNSRSSKTLVFYVSIVKIGFASVASISRYRFPKCDRHVNELKIRDVATPQGSVCRFVPVGESSGFATTPSVSSSSIAHSPSDVLKVFKLSRNFCPGSVFLLIHTVQLVKISLNATSPKWTCIPS